MRAREIPVDPRRFVIAESRRAMTPLEALMQCPPGVEPLDDVAGGGALRILLDEALQELELRESPRQQGRMKFIIEATVIERRSLRDVGRALGLSKTHVARLRDQALAFLQDALAEHPHIREALRDQ